MRDLKEHWTFAYGALVGLILSPVIDHFNEFMTMPHPHIATVLAGVIALAWWTWLLWRDDAGP